MRPWFFVTFNIIINHIFPENFTEIPQVVQKIWRLSLSILAIFFDFLDFLTFPCFKKTDDVSLKQMMSSFFHFQHTLNRLLNNCIKLYWCYISFSCNKFFLLYYRCWTGLYIDLRRYWNLHSEVRCSKSLQLLQCVALLVLFHLKFASVAAMAFEFRYDVRYVVAQNSLLTLVMMLKSYAKIEKRKCLLWCLCMRVSEAAVHRSSS